VKTFLFAASGLGEILHFTHGLRRGLHSFAALRLNSSFHSTAIEILEFSRSL